MRDTIADVQETVNETKETEKNNRAVLQDLRRTLVNNATTVDNLVEEIRDIRSMAAEMSYGVDKVDALQQAVKNMAAELSDARAASPTRDVSEELQIAWAAKVTQMAQTAAEVEDMRKRIRTWADVNKR